MCVKGWKQREEPKKRWHTPGGKLKFPGKEPTGLCKHVRLQEARRRLLERNPARPTSPWNSDTKVRRSSVANIAALSALLQRVTRRKSAGPSSQWPSRSAKFNANLGFTCNGGDDEAGRNCLSSTDAHLARDWSTVCLFRIGCANRDTGLG